MASTADGSSTDGGQGSLPTASANTPHKDIPLPMEIVHMILQYLAPLDLAAVSCVSRALYLHATSDKLWRAIVQENVPGIKLTSPDPFDSFRELYVTHYPCWFIPQKKLWLGGDPIVGNLLIARYEPRRARIEGYRLLPIPWTADNQENRASFSRLSDTANLRLHVEQPLVVLDGDDQLCRLMQLRRSRFPHFLAPGPTPLSRPATAASTPPPPMAPKGGPWLSRRHSRRLRDLPIVLQGLANDGGLLHRNLIFATPLSPEREQALRSNPSYLAPPPRIPAPHRVLSEKQFRLGQLMRPPSQETTMDIWMRHGGDLDYNDNFRVTCRPYKRAQLSEHAFHIRTWEDTMHHPVVGLQDGNFEAGREREQHLRINTVDTFATIDSVYYTPTADKPFRGIFMADYGGHGYEVVLIHQPDDVEPFDEAAVVASQRDGETAAEYEERRRNARIYRGKLEAIKLTGDTNVPRGEITFVADDLSATDNSGSNMGFAGITLAGVPRIYSKGHIANPGYQNDQFIDCRLFLITSDWLAVYWISLSYVNFYKRVDIDVFTKPGVSGVKSAQVQS